jgi:hypothetical protein
MKPRLLNNKVRFQLKLNVPLDVVQSNGFLISSTTMKQSMQRWFNSTNKICLLKKISNTDDINTLTSCANVLFMDCNNLSLICESDDDTMFKYLNIIPDKKLVYTPYGFGKIDITPTHRIVHDISIDYIHIHIAK